MTAFYGFPRDSHSYSAEEVGHALAGLVQRESSGLPCVGMLSVGPDFDAVPASWRVQVGRFVYVHQAAGAIQLSGLSAPEQVDIASASAIPAGQSRIDLVGWNPASAELVVVEGAPSATPVAPTNPLLARVGTVQVNAGDGMVVAGQVAPGYELSGLSSVPDLRAYTPVVSGYSAGFAPEMRAQYTQLGNVIEVELQAVTDREVVRFTGPLLVTVPVPIGATPISVDGGGYMLVGPAGAKRLVAAKVRQASQTQVVVELTRVWNGLVELVSVGQAGLASTDWVSWRVRFRYSVS